MGAKLTFCSALTIALVSATAGFAQTMQYDRTGDHMASYGPVYTGRTTPVAHHHATVRAPSYKAAPILDRTADHMFYYGPVH